MNPDAVVIGAGLAGMAAAIRISEAGGRVMVVAKGIPSLYLRGGTIDVLGYAPERVDDPTGALPGWCETHPSHPYAGLESGQVAASVEWLGSLLVPYGYTGSMSRNFLLPTAIGSARPTALVPGSMAAGALEPGRQILVAGLRGLKDFYAALAAQNLARIPGLHARAVEVALPVGGADPGPLAFARALEDPEVRKRLGQELAANAAPGEIIGLPAVLGVSLPGELWRELQDLTGHPVFEIPGPPPSIPGMRLYFALRNEVRRRSIRMVVGAGIKGFAARRGTVNSVDAAAAGRPVTYRAGAFVLATGSFQSGGLELDRTGMLHETVFGLPVFTGSPAGEPFHPDYFAVHPINTAGLSVDERRHPVDEGGEAVYANLFAAGGIIGGAEPWREKSAEGISVATAVAAAASLAEASSS